MKVDANTPIGDLLAAVAYDAVLPADVAAQNAARAELTRRSELAAKYERLTQTLAGLSARSDEARFVCLAKDGIELHYGKPADVDWRFTRLHNGTPDGIAAAIIAAAEGAK